MNLETLIAERTRIEHEHRGRISILDSIIDRWQAESLVGSYNAPPPPPPAQTTTASPARKPGTGKRPAATAPARKGRSEFSPGSMRGQLLDLIRAQPDEWSLDTIRNAFPDIKSGTLSGFVAKMKSNGWIESTRPKHYRNTASIGAPGAKNTAPATSRIERDYRKLRDEIIPPSTDTE